MKSLNNQNYSLFWEVPEELAFNYLIKICLIMVGLPYLFGLVFTPIGALLNFFLIDWVIFRSYQNHGKFNE
jgi:hypothetical protein